jgi:chromosome segregation ATPase
VPFSVNDFHDLLAVLGTHPEWRDELRRLVLADELLGLPALVRELGTAQQRTEQRLEELAAAQQRTEQRLEELAAAQQRTEHRLEELALRVDALAAAQQRTEQRMESLAVRMDELAAALRQTAVRVDALRGGVLEIRFRDQGGAGARAAGIPPRQGTLGCRAPRYGR